MIRLPVRQRLTRQERQSRAVLGMAPRHPEWLTRELPADQEEWLAMAAEVAWPEDEYVAEILSTPAPAVASPVAPQPRSMRSGMRRARFTAAERREFRAALDTPPSQWTPSQRRLVIRFDEAVMR